MIKKEETKKVFEKEEKKEISKLNQAKEEQKKKINQLPKLEQDLLTLVCLYSLMEADIIGPILANLMSEYEGVEYQYCVLLADRVLKEHDRHLFSKSSIAEKNPLNRRCQYAIAKKDEMLLYGCNDKTITEMEADYDALIIHEAHAPITRIPFFDKGNYLFKVEKYKRYPYILDFLDYVISRKAAAYNYQLDTFPIYTELELYIYLKDFLAINLLRTKEKEKVEELVKKLILRKDDVA